jgi:hypothetical protein
MDIRILPILFILLILNYLDRNALALARVQGIEADLGMAGRNFNTAISVLFVGYIIGQVPSNLALTRARPSLYIPGFAVLWGAVSATTAAANSFGHLVAIRFFLGVCEAPFFPGILFFLSSWYTKQELAVSVTTSRPARLERNADKRLSFVSQWWVEMLTPCDHEVDSFTVVHWGPSVWGVCWPHSSGYSKWNGRPPWPGILEVGQARASLRTYG